MAERRSGLQRWFVTTEAHGFGHGWISGTIGAVLGIAGLGIVICWLLPARLTLPELRAALATPATRVALHGALLVAVGLGLLSLVLRRKKTLGVIALGTAALAALLGLVAGEPRAAATDHALGLDFFALNLLVYAAVFVPLERLWPHRDGQPTFRTEWWTDLAWFTSSALLVQLTTFLILWPAESLTFAISPWLQTQIRALPMVWQFVLIVAVADLVQYWVHYACHRVPWLWRFHAIHHSAEAMDWLAGSRLHIVDAVLTRGLIYATLFVLGFAPLAIGAYLLFVAAQATFVHANVGWRLGWLEPLLATPRFHHWHHAEAPADKNFAVHLPLYDRLFGTFHMPGEAWPTRYGLASGKPGPRGFWRQLVAPFTRR